MESIVNEPDMSYGKYTYADYLKWTIEERFELIKGKVFKMSPGPATKHQVMVGFVFNKLYNHLQGKSCKVFVAPFDVRLPRKSVDDKSITTVLQPDVCVVCDPSKIDERGIIGAPDIVVEILSPGNNRKELANKYEVYEEAGVKEYWIIHPTEKTFFRYLLDAEGKFQPQRLLTMGDEVRSDVLPDFVLDLEEAFKDV